ncbi:MAG: tyrosine-type recombinase/integrase [Mycobacterium sp.]
MAARTPKPKRRRERGDDGISWDKVNKCYVGTISLGYDDTGKRLRRFVRGKTKQEVKDKLNDLHEEIKAGIYTPATYTVKRCVMDWLDSLELDPHTTATYRGQAEKWIYPRIGAKKLAEFKATDADRFLRDVAEVLSKSSLVKIKSTLVRSIRRAQKYDLIGRNVAELVDLPQGQPGHPSRAMTEDQASKVLQAANGKPTGFVRVVKVSQGKYAATHAATETDELACGTWTRLGAPVTEIGTELAKTTCRFCRQQLGLDAGADTVRRLEALFVLSITLGLRPGELRKLSWDHVDLDNAVIHVWRSASRTGDVKTPKSKRSLVLPKRAVAALQAHRKRQAAERLTAGAAWQDNNLVFCHEDGRMYTSDALNWRFSKMTKRAGIGHWHAHEGRHTAVSIMSSNGVPLQEISDTVGHKSTHVTETVYRHVIVPAIRGGATVMDAVFGDVDNTGDEDDQVGTTGACQVRVPGRQVSSGSWATVPAAEFLRRGRPLGLANAPSSRARSCRIGWTRMTLPSRDSCTDPATMDTSMDWRAQPRPAW